MIHSKNSFRCGWLALALLTGIADAPGVAAADKPGDFTATRPDAEGKPTRVSIGVFVVDIPEIDDAKQTFKADFYVKISWKDPRLASSEGDRSIPLNKVWHPPFQILNRRNLDLLLPEVVSVNQNGTVTYDQRFQGSFAVPLDLRNFPLDEQVLAFRFVSPGHSPAEVELVPDDRSGRAEHFTIMEWTIGPTTTKAEPFVVPERRHLAGYICTLPAHSRAGAYVYAFVIPLTFIVCMSWATFWMAPEQLGPRQGIAVTSMLTIIAYRFVVTSQLPRVAYLTRFDYLLLGCTALVFLVLVQVVAGHAAMTKGQPERARKLDLWSRGVFPSLFLALCLVVWVF
jgi:hypothetical protein